METEPGPFILPPLVTVNFIQQCSINTPQLESVLSTASMMITQHSRQDTNRAEPEIKLIFVATSGFMQALGRSTGDPGVAAACIDICNRMIPKYSSILFNEMSWSTLDFMLSALTAPDTLPKKSACEFSVQLLSMKNPPPAASTETQRRIDETIAAYGPKFADCLMIQVGGLAHRSDLNMLCEPLKAFLLNHKDAQKRLQHGLASELFPNPDVTEEEKIRFLRQCVGVQSDGRKLKEVVRAFWAACRGTVVSYGS